jgi:hypothetical protein
LPIGKVQISPATVVAPMADVTGTVFRRFIRDRAAAVYFLLLNHSKSQPPWGRVQLDTYSSSVGLMGSPTLLYTISLGGFGFAGFGGVGAAAFGGDDSGGDQNWLGDWLAGGDGAAGDTGAVAGTATGASGGADSAA